MKLIAIRTLCIATLLCLLFSLSACGSDGTYTISEIKFGDDTFNTEAIKERELDPETCYITLASDGTGVICLFGETALIEWEGNVIWPAGNKGQAYPFQLEGNKLTLEKDGDTLIFTR